MAIAKEVPSPPESMKSLVSIITPVRNMAATLQRAHESVRAQSCHWQHIVVDDGSTDGTPQVVESIAEDPRVIAIRTANRGIGAALNTGLHHASGDFVAFLDADDEFLPNHLNSHLEAFLAHPDADLFWGGLEVVTDHPDDVLVPDVTAGFGFISIHECVTQGTLFVRRHVFEQIQFSEERVCFHDYDFMQKVQSLFQVRRFEEPTYRYYRNTASSVVDRLKANWPKSAREE